MNLVIDDAVEVSQVTKTNDKETRRQLGMKPQNASTNCFATNILRPNLAQGGQRFTDPKLVKLNDINDKLSKNRPAL